MVVVKLVCGQDVRRFKSDNDSWNDVYLQVVRLHGENSKVRYIDEDQDLVLIDSQGEFDEALKLKTGAPLRLLVERSADFKTIAEETAIESAEVRTKGEASEKKPPEKSAKQSDAKTEDINPDEGVLEKAGNTEENQPESLMETKKTAYENNEQNVGEAVNAGEMNNSTNENMGSSTLHLGVTCDECGQSPIRGVRYKCVKCINYDSCENCEQQNRHDSSHFMLKMKVSGGLDSSCTTYRAPYFCEFLPPHHGHVRLPPPPNGAPMYAGPPPPTGPAMFAGPPPPAGPAMFAGPPPPGGPAMFAGPPPVPYGPCQAWYCPPGFCDSIMGMNETSNSVNRNDCRQKFTNHDTLKESIFGENNAGFEGKKTSYESVSKSPSNSADPSADSNNPGSSSSEAHLDCISQKKLNKNDSEKNVCRKLQVTAPVSNDAEVAVLNDQLREMGFNNDSENIGCLEKFGKDLNVVIPELIRKYDS